jgi:hypothetical protein
MSETLTTKPEPLPAKPRWHYDSYFVAQLQRQGESTDAGHVTSEVVAGAKPEASCQLAPQRNEIIKQIMELADSIGVSARIIDPG